MYAAPVNVKRHQTSTLCNHLCKVGKRNWKRLTLTLKAFLFPMNYLLQNIYVYFRFIINGETCFLRFNAIISSHWVPTAIYFFMLFVLSLKKKKILPNYHNDAVYSASDPNKRTWWSYLTAPEGLLGDAVLTEAVTECEDVLGMRRDVPRQLTTRRAAKPESI